jgi:hypothetical protein
MKNPLSCGDDNVFDFRFTICDLILARGNPESFRGYKFKSGGDHGGHAMSAF